MDLRQSTACVITFGPFVDPTDGKTPVTGLVSALDHATTGIKLSKNGGALTIRHATVTATTYDTYGNYLVTLDTTDTNTLGKIRAQFADASTNLPVWVDCMVLTAVAWDALYASSGGAMPADAVKVGGTTQTGRDLGANVLLSPGTGTGQVDLSSGAIKTVLNVQTTSTYTPFTLTQAGGLALVGDYYFINGILPAVTLTLTTNVLTNPPPDSTGITTLLSRLSSARAGYIDNASAGPLATAAALAALDTGGLSGANQVTLLFNDSANVRVPYVEFSVVGQGVARANATGSALIGLNTGTYTLLAAPTAQAIFPATSNNLVVTGATTLTLTGMSNSVTPSSDPGACIIFYTTRGSDNTPKSGVNFNVTAHSGNTRPIVVTSSGTLTNNTTFTLQQGLVFSISRSGGPDVVGTVPASGSANLVDLVGTIIIGRDETSP